jgi:hypothetical protein
VPAGTLVARGVTKEFTLLASPSCLRLIEHYAVAARWIRGPGILHD